MGRFTIAFVLIFLLIVMAMSAWKISEIDKRVHKIEQAMGERLIGSRSHIPQVPKF